MSTPSPSLQHGITSPPSGASVTQRASNAPCDRGSANPTDHSCLSSTAPRVEAAAAPPLAATPSPHASQEQQSHSYTTSVMSLLRRFLPPKDESARERDEAVPTTVPGKGAGQRTALLSPRHHQHHSRHRLKVAVVGESDSGRTSLCKSLESAALCKTRHPLVVSGSASNLRIDSSVFSVRTFDVQCGARDIIADAQHSTLDIGDRLLEVTIVDSGPSPLTHGAASLAVMEADVILLCFPLYGIKQVLAKDGGGTQSGGHSTGAKPTEAFIHPKDVQLFTTLLVLLSGRCAPSDASGIASSPPTLVLVGTFQDALRDASVAATHTILRAFRRLCERTHQHAPSTLPVSSVCAVSTVQSTSVSLDSDKQYALDKWWRQTLLQADLRQTTNRLASAQSSQKALDDMQHTPSLPSAALRHLLAHPNRLLHMNDSLRSINSRDGCPRLLGLSLFRNTTTDACTFGGREVGTAELRAQDARSASLLVDFISQLKRRQRIWLLPLSYMWRVAYALGMQTREQLYLVLRQMEAAGEISLLGRGLSYTQESAMDTCVPTNETICLCPAIVRASLAILYVYSNWLVQHQRRHVRRCLRGVDPEACAVCDPERQAAKGVFPLSLLQQLAVALRLEKVPAVVAAEELVIAALVGSDVGYLVREAHRSDSTVTERTQAKPAVAPPRPPPPSPPLFADAHGPLQPPSPTCSGSAPSSAGVSPVHRGRALLPVPSSDAADTVSPVSTDTGDSSRSYSSQPSSEAKAAKEDEAGADYAPNITVAELTSIFLLGDITASLSAHSSAEVAEEGDPDARVKRGTTTQPLSHANEAAASHQRSAAPDEVFLVLPCLQPSEPCPKAVLQHVRHALHSPLLPSEGLALHARELQFRIDPAPFDLMASLTCRLASVALRVEKTYADAVLLSFDVPRLLHPTQTHIPLYRVQEPTVVPGQQPRQPDGCVFLHCSPTADKTVAVSAASLQLVVIAESAVRVAFLEAALSKELHLLLTQRAPGVAVVLERAAASGGGGHARDASTSPLPACPTVGAFLLTIPTV